MSPSSPRRAAYRISQLGDVATRRFAKRVKELGLTPPSAGVLRLLARSPGISQRDLADRLGALPSRVVVLLDTLEARGLVTRRRSETDRRHHELALTEAGRALMGELREVATEHEASFVEVLSDREREQLGALLDKLAAAHGLDPVVHPGYRDA